MMSATKHLKEHLKPDEKSAGSSWWRDDHFKPGVALPCGSKNFSPVALPQGHKVCGLLPYIPD